MGYRILFTISLTLLLFGGGSAFAVTPNEIKSAIESRYKITIPGFLGDFKEIGSVLLVQKEGLRADRPWACFKPNVMKGGQIETAGGGDLPLGNNVESSLKIGDRLHLYGVLSRDNYVELRLFTVKAFIITGSGKRGPIPLQASTRFQYDEGLGAVTAKKVMEDIDTWFKAEDGARDDAEPKSKFEAKAKDDARSRSMATSTVQLGQTLEKVIAILGSPEKKILLGAKTILVYKDLKLVFIEGKLTDAE